MTRISTPLFFSCLLLGATHAAWADNMLPVSPLLKSESGDSDAWRVSVSPYIWASGISGKVGQFGQPPARLNSSFSDVMSELDVAFMGAVDARHGRFSLLGDVMYSQLSGSGNTDFGILSRSVKIKSKSFSGFVGAGYTVLESDRGHLDVIGGARLWSASTKIAFNGGALGGRSRTDSATWVDAVAGVRGQYALNERWYLTGWGVIGAGQAKLDWDVTAALGYQFESNLSAMLGYRALGVNYDRNGFVYNVIQQGPILGFAYRF